jgi:hypothetical protein
LRYAKRHDQCGRKADTDHQYGLLAQAHPHLS